jgi:cytochrome c-type biogenesis protein CcmH
MASCPRHPRTGEAPSLQIVMNEGFTVIKRLLLAVVVMTLAVMGSVVAAQDAGTEVTTDDVNQIANKMYCPVCENIPLDDCGTAACNDWREEIRLFLQQGMTEEEIINNFIDRFGDRVVGTPRDPVLRAMSLWTPFILAAVALVVALGTIFRGREGRRLTEGMDTELTPDDLRSQLERDLNG